jgi:hypothetical protein
MNNLVRKLERECWRTATLLPPIIVMSHLCLLHLHETCFVTYDSESESSNRDEFVSSIMYLRTENFAVASQESINYQLSNP